MMMKIMMMMMMMMMMMKMSRRRIERQISWNPLVTCRYESLLDTASTLGSTDLIFVTIIGVSCGGIITWLTSRVTPGRAPNTRRRDAFACFVIFIFKVIISVLTKLIYHKNKHNETDGRTDGQTDTWM